MKMKIRSMNLFFAAFVFVCFVNGQAVRADLILSIDVAAKEVFFTGTDSGNAALFSGRDTVLWGDSQAGASLDLSTGIDVTGVFNPSVVAFDLGSNALSGYAFQLVQFSGGTGAAGTITGNGTRISYAGLSGLRQSILEISIGTTKPLESFGGSGFQPLQVVAASEASAVPEPSSLIMLGIGVACLGLARLRKRHIGSSDRA